MNTNFKRWPALVITGLLAALLTLPALAQVPSGFPYETKPYQNKILLKGFDPAEFGGDDANCPLKNDQQPDSIHIGEVVGSEGETCKLVVEWSLKTGSTTIVSGVYANEPGEWYYVPLAVEGVDSPMRFVGTIWRIPRNWNAHQFAVDIAKARDDRDGTTSIVGLSMTDEWVVKLAGTTNPGGGGAPGASPSSGSDQPAPSGGQTCTVTSSAYKYVNVRKGPGTSHAIVRTEKVGAVITFIEETGGWKKLAEGQYMLGTLCTATEQADG